MIRILTLWTLLVSAVAVGQLQIEEPERIIKAKPNQHDFDATFKFKNIGTKDITITKIKTSCSCTAAKLKKRTYGPGEIGEISAKLHILNSSGLHKKKITIFTKEPDPKRYDMIIGADIPEYVKVLPRYMRWWRDSKPEKREIEIDVKHEKPIRVVKIDSTNEDDWTVTLVSVKEGQKYKIEVQPRSTAKSSRTLLTITMDFPEDEPLKYKVTVRVSAHPDPKKRDEKSWLKKVF